jgi:hypothetical protein
VDLVRSWLGQALRATGAAVAVPAAILVALSLTAVGGSGLGGLGALSQIVSGPGVAGSDVAVDDGETEIDDAVTQLAASDPGGAVGAPGVTTGAPGQGPGGGDVPGARTPTPGGGGGGDTPGGGDIDGPAPPGGGGGGGAPAPPEPPPPQQPGVVQGLGQTITDTTAGTPVAPTVEDAVDGLVELCGRLGCP